MAARLGTVRRAVSLAVEIDRNRAVTVLALGILLSGVPAATALSQRWLVDSAGLGSIAGVATAVVVGTAAYAMSTVGRRLESNLRGDLSHHVATHLSRDVAATAATIPGVSHLERPDFLDRITLVRRGTYAMAGAGWSVVEAAAHLVSLGLSVWLLMAVHPALALAALLAVPPLYLANRGRRLVQQATDETAELERVEADLHQLCIDAEAAKEIRTSRSGKTVSVHADTLWAEALRRRARAQTAAAVLQLGGWLCYATGFALALMLVTSLVADQRATVGDVVLVISLAGQLRGQIAATVDGITQLADAGRAIGYYQWLGEYAAEQKRSHGSQHPPTALRRGITLRGVRFQYPGTDRPVLSDIDVHLPAGQTVAVVGINGAGKSTLAKLLTGMYQSDAGSIDVDGIPLSSIDPVLWRTRVTGAFQDFAKFEFVARETVGVGDLPHADDEPRVRQAVTSAGADVDVANLPDGLDTQLGRTFDGVQLSHGQWQKLALARGHMRDGPLLVILDEPTAALDPQAEHDLHERFVQQAQATMDYHGTVTVLVSHRFSTVRIAEKIIVLDNGRIAEVGTHDELMAANHGYAANYRAQAAGYAPQPQTASAYPPAQGEGRS